MGYYKQNLGGRLIAEIIVDVSSRSVDKTFDYEVPLRLEKVIEIGQRVKVPFGPRFVMGYVVSLKRKSDIKKLKEIKEILDIEPVLTNELLSLGKKMKSMTISPLVTIYQVMVPAALKAKYTKTLLVQDNIKLPKEIKELVVNNEIKYERIPQDLLYVVKKLLRENILLLKYNVSLRERKKIITYLRYQKDTDKRLGRKQKLVLDYLKDKNKVSTKEIQTKLNVSNNTINSLLAKGLISKEKKETYRNIEHIYKPSSKRVKLTEQQRKVEEELISSLNKRKTILLHGVTGSGKTELYLNIIEKVINEGKEAILLVPEISLTPMMASRFKGRFKDNVALLHSGLSLQEKYDEWRKVKRKKVKVVVGARSAIFAPFENLGIIIIDEEHTDSYKQDSIPSYHARDVAFMRADKYNIPIILGSATPSIESYYHAKQNDYYLLELKERANETFLPSVHIIDMRDEFSKGNRTIFSNRLKELIINRLAKKEKVMMLLNRRGHSTFVLCRSCGEVIMCPNCDISLTYHEDTQNLKCHYCGHKENKPLKCPSCQSPYIRYMGLGTEQVEGIVKREFPNANVIRMDHDNTRRKNAHEKLLYEFDKNGDILIGTQMIAKGLDFPEVTLVGVLAADMSLNLPDYKATEKTFQLLTQVAGRAGRGDILGEVIIQTYNPDHYTIKAAKNHDYTSFYETEIKIRSLAMYAPIVRLIQIIIADKDVKKTLKIGAKIVYDLKKVLPKDVIILGPVLPKIARIKSTYRAQIIIKDKQNRKLDNILHDIYIKYQEEIMIAFDYHPDLL